MISTIFNLSLSILIPLGAGYVCLLILFRKQILSLPLTIALSYGLGAGLLAMWMLFLFIVPQSFDISLIRTPFVLATIFLFLFYLMKLRNTEAKIGNMPQQSPTRQSRFSLGRIPRLILNIFLILYVAHTSLYVIWRSMTVPVSSWDAIATVAFKAKIFFHEPTLPLLKLLPHKSYPLFVPFMESWTAFNLGYWDDLLIKIIFPCVFISFLTIQYKFLTQFTNRTWALLGCMILLSSNFFIYHATISYRDFAIMYFNCITIILLIYWSQYKTNAFLILSALFAGFTTFTKLEGTGYLLIHALLVIYILCKDKSLSLNGKLKKFATFAVPSLLICLPFHFYKMSQEVAGMSGRMGLEISQENTARLPSLLGDFTSNLFLSGNWNIIWALLMVSLFCHFRKVSRSLEVQLLLFPLLMFFALYLIILTLTPENIMNFGLLSRIILHFFPLSVLLITLLNYPDFSYSEEKENPLRES